MQWLSQADIAHFVGSIQTKASKTKLRKLPQRMGALENQLVRPN